MKLTKKERENWEAYKKQHPQTKRFDQAREQKIIELSVQGVTIKEIRAEVGGSYEIIHSTRMKARRLGLW